MEWAALVSGSVPSRVLELAGAWEKKEQDVCLVIHVYALVLLKGPICDRRSSECCLNTSLNESKQ